ncbi:MAG: hypothetical protein FIB06_03255 [Betaproteobacteria bacterium]|nr:hypothetical protein [Betaproteobacteria bacterium]
MKAVIQFFSSLGALMCAIVLSVVSVPTRAADTDLFFTGAGGTSARPNVLILLDNTANWGPMFANEKNALLAVLRDLEPNVFNLGLAMYVETGGGNDNKDGAYVRFAVRNFDDIDTDFTTDRNAAESLYRVVSGLHEINDRSNNAVYGLAMNEAYKYFKGGISFSQGQVKRDYPGNAQLPAFVRNDGNNAFYSSGNYQYRSPSVDVCQQNHVIIISNGKGNDSARATGDATDALTTEGGDTTPIPVTPNDFQSLVADEWARFMSRERTESEVANNTVKPVVTTHAILVEAAGAPAGQYPDGWEPYLKSVAANGKGTYQKTDGQEANIKAALDKAFKEIAAVNSVFASSTLPINVNVRGTFLNQVYMGVFRPEAQASPRWTGNLKLYKLAYDSATDRTFLADKNGATAEDPRSGFIKSSATSFWTNTSAFWNQSFESGFYAYRDVKTVSDAPDGDFVEKGGAAQQIRTTYATDTSGRPIYTCIGCSSALDDFSTSNSAITATKLALADTVSISSLNRSGTVVTAVTSSAHNFASGDNITIAGSSDAAYNKTASISVVNATTFTYVVTETPPASASGTLVGTRPSGGTVAVTQITRAGNVATAQAAGHGFTVGQTVTIANSSEAAYNIAAMVTAVVPGVSFSFAVSETPSTTISFAGAVVCPAPTAITTCPAAASTKAITGASRTAGNALTSISTANANHGLTTGSFALITGLSPAEYNGRYAITKTDNKNFTYTPAITLGPGSATNAGMTASGTATPVSITALTRGASNGSGVAVVTGTTALAHGWGPGNSIQISGANEPAYNGTFTLATAAGSTFTFTITTGPAMSGGAATATRAGNISRDELINWVRGQNRLGEDNPSNDPAHIRGYVMGDVLHSRPAVVNYGRTTDTDIIVFYGANDGMLHAVKGGRSGTGAGLEKWAYVAEDHLPALKQLFAATPSVLTTPRKFYFDGSITVEIKDADNDGVLAETGDHVWLYAAMRRGGRGIHALDVSNPDAAPTLLWRKNNSSPGYAELGQTWSEVQPITIAAPPVSGVPQTKRVVVFSLGYDEAANDPTGTSTSSSRQSTATMGRGFVVAEADTGTPLFVATGNTTYESGTWRHLPVTGMDCAIAGDVSAVDIDLNGVTDRFYLADTCANIWRVNVRSDDVANWTVQKLASLGGTGTNLRKLFFRPDVIRIAQEPGKLAVVVGTGDREAPYDTTVSNAVYMIKDNVDDATCTTCGITPAQLCERNTVTNTTAVATCTSRCSGQTAIDATTGLTCFQACLAELTPCAVNTADTSTRFPLDTSLPLVPVIDRGWKFTFPTVGEKVINAPLTVGGTVFFGTNVPQSLLSAQQCSNLGEARLYQVEFTTGTPASDSTRSGISSYYTTKAGGGFPPSPVGTVVTTDEGKTVEVVLSGPQIQQPPTIPVEKRFRIYWYKAIDR